MFPSMFPSKFDDAWFFFAFFFVASAVPPKGKVFRAAPPGRFILPGALL